VADGWHYFILEWGEEKGDPPHLVAVFASVEEVKAAVRPGQELGGHPNQAGPRSW
jgi:hypothetical protein